VRRGFSIRSSSSVWGDNRMNIVEEVSLATPNCEWAYRCVVWDEAEEGDAARADSVSDFGRQLQSSRNPVSLHL